MAARVWNACGETKRISPASRGRYVCSSTGEQRMRETASPTSSAPGSHILSLSLSLRNEYRCADERPRGLDPRLEQDSRASRGNKNANQVSRGPINPADSRSSPRSALVDDAEAAAGASLPERIVAPTVDFHGGETTRRRPRSSISSSPGDTRSQGHTCARARELLRPLELHYGELRWPSSTLSSLRASLFVCFARKRE